MKKIVFGIILFGIIAGVVFARGGQQTAATAADATRPTVRLLTDATGIDDKSFNAAAWRGILQFYGDTWQNQRQRGRY